MTTSTATARMTGSGLVLLTLATGQFLMTLDTSVMNVSMAQVAADVGTTITGIQTAITLYTLVMATMMITGGKIGTNIGRRRAFALGCVIYGIGSFVTAISPSLTVLLLGWSLLEGLGAALIMPAIVALVAGNFARPDRPRAYGLVAASGAIAVAVGPLVGGAATTYFSWRWVFASETLIVLAILALSRRIADAPAEGRKRLDLVGTLLSAAGLGMAVYGVLKSSEWGWVRAKPDAAQVGGISLTLWLIVLGLLTVWLFFQWENRVLASGGEPLVRPAMLANPRLAAGLKMFFVQFMLQSGVFFIVPLFLSVVLELPAIETGLKLMPLSVSLLIAAVGIPRLRPHASPRRTVRIGMLLLLAGILVLMGGIDLDASAAAVSVPMFLIGLGMGCLASQLGAVTVSSVPDEESGEVGGLQNTSTNLGASLGTALAGSVLIGVLTASVISGFQGNPDIPAQVQEQATVQLASGVPFLSDTQLEQALAAAGVPAKTAQAVTDVNRQSRVEGLDAALAVLAILAIAGLFLTGGIPQRQPGAPAEDAVPPRTTAASSNQAAG